MILDVCLTVLKSYLRWIYAFAPIYNCIILYLFLLLSSVDSSYIGYFPDIRSYGGDDIVQVNGWGGRYGDGIVQPMGGVVARVLT